MASLAAYKNYFGGLGNIRGTRSLKNAELCSAILDRLQLEQTYAPHSTQVLSMNPANGLFATMLHNRIQPKQHVVMGNSLGFKGQWAKLSDEFNMPLDLVNKDPYDWESFTTLINEDKVLVPERVSRDTIHPTFLVTGSLVKNVRCEGLMVQWLHCIANRNWLQRFGRVRMLLWVTEHLALKLLAPVGVTRRARVSVYCDQFTETSLVAMSVPAVKYPTLGYWGADELERHNPIIMDRLGDLLQSATDAQNLCLLDIQPTFHNLDLDAFEYVTKQLLIQRSLPLSTAMATLGPGAHDFYRTQISDELMAKRPMDLTNADWREMADVFVRWPFRPENYLVANATSLVSGDM